MLEKGLDVKKETLYLIEQAKDPHLNVVKVVGVIIILIAVVLLGILFARPTVKVNGEKIERIPYKSEFVDSGITVNYHGEDITNQVVMSSNVDTSKLGKYKITYKIPYWFGTYVYKRKAVVVDNMSPDIVLTGEQEYKIAARKNYVEPGYKAIDNYDGDITDKVEVSEVQINDKQKEIHYKVTDKAGNKHVKVRKVIKVDIINPKIELIGQGSVYINIGEQYKEQGVKVKDESGAELSTDVEIIGTVNTNKEGRYTITYKVFDNNGKETVATREVLVGYIGKASMNVGKPRTIYLTFDDGPSRTSTPKILNILKQNGVKATFFVLDYGADKEDLIRRIVQEGHSIAIHSKSHDYKKIYTSADAYLSGINYMQQKIQKTAGVKTNLIRFPGGSSNTISRHYCKGVMSKLAKETLNRGYRYFDWNVPSGDSGDVDTAKAVYKNVKRGVQTTRANVVLMHDFDGNTKTIEALPRVIKFGKENGYTFERITDQTPMITHNVNN